MGIQIREVRVNSRAILSLADKPTETSSSPMTNAVIGTLWSSQLSAPLGWVLSSQAFQSFLQIDFW